MAKVGFWLRGSRGKLAGASMGRGAKGQTVIREIVTPKNPQSAAQCIQRMKAAPAQKFFNTFSNLLNNAFEGVPYGADSRRYFIGKAMKQDGPYIPKGVDRFIPAIYPFSEGSLPSVPIQGFAAGTSLITLDVKSSETTITPAILAAALDVDTDTQISVVIVNNHSGLFVPEYAGFEERIKISELPANALDKDDDGYIRIDPSELGLTVDAMVACCVVLSKQDASGSWLRSTQDMVISDELYASLYSTDALTNAIASYQDAGSNNSINSDWYYNLGMAQPFPGSLRTMYMENNGAVSKKMVVGIKVVNGVTRYTVFANAGLTGMMEVKEDGTLGYTEGNDFNDAWAQSKGYSIGVWEDAMAAQLGQGIASGGNTPSVAPVYWRPITGSTTGGKVLVDVDGKVIAFVGTGGDEPIYDNFCFITKDFEEGIPGVHITDQGEGIAQSVYNDFGHVVTTGSRSGGGVGNFIYEGNEYEVTIDDMQTMNGVMSPEATGDYPQ